MSNTYYQVIGKIEGQYEILFGSFSRNDCVEEIDAERDSWKDQGYTHIKIGTTETDDKPDPEVYAGDDDVVISDDDLQAKIDELQRQKINTGGHGRRARIQQRIDALQAQLDAQQQADVDADDDDDDAGDSVPGLVHHDTIDDLVNYLSTVLIPDLVDAGRDATAEDFEDCISAIRHLQANQRPEPLDSEEVLRNVILRGRPEVC